MFGAMASFDENGGWGVSRMGRKTIPDAWR
jgi:hypothetical protein